MPIPQPISMFVESDDDEEVQEGRTLPPFSSEQKDWLQTHVPAYLSAEHSVKGDKKKWVKTEVLPGFNAKFVSGAINHQEVLKKLARWFSNQENTSKTRVVKPKVVKKPKATNGYAVFRSDASERIHQRLQELRTETKSSDNLALHRQATQELWDELSGQEQDEFHAKAEALNEARTKSPPKEHIYTNQKQILLAVTDTLGSLQGWEWNQYGDAVFFVMGAFRDEKDRLQSFTTSIHNSKLGGGFVPQSMPELNFDEGIRKAFKNWAAQSLPRSEHLTKTLPAKLTVSFADSGRPILPAISEDIAPSALAPVLTEVILGLWEHAVPTGCALPWDLVNSNRSAFLLNAQAFTNFKHLEPAKMSGREIFEFYELVSQDVDIDTPLPFSFMVENEGRQLLGLAQVGKSADRDTISSARSTTPLSATINLGEMPSRPSSQPLSINSFTLDADAISGSPLRADDTDALVIQQAPVSQVGSKVTAKGKGKGVNKGKRGGAQSKGAVVSDEVKGRVDPGRDMAGVASVSERQSKRKRVLSDATIPVEHPELTTESQTQEQSPLHDTDRDHSDKNAAEDEPQPQSKRRKIVQQVAPDSLLATRVTRRNAGAAAARKTAVPGNSESKSKAEGTKQKAAPKGKAVAQAASAPRRRSSRCK